MHVCVPPLAIYLELVTVHLKFIIWVGENAQQNGPLLLLRRILVSYINMFPFFCNVCSYYSHLDKFCALVTLLNAKVYHTNSL